MDRDSIVYMVRARAGRPGGRRGRGPARREERGGSRALGMAPDSERHLILSNRSACYASVGKLNAAIADVEKCIEIKPEWGKGYSRLGVALFKKGDLDGAQKAYAGGIACDPNNVQCDDGLAEVRKAKEQQMLNGGKMADMSLVEPVIGIDLGSRFLKVGIIQPGVGIELVLNEATKDSYCGRRLSSILRRIGARASAASHMAMKCGDTSSSSSLSLVSSSFSLRRRRRNSRPARARPRPSPRATPPRRRPRGPNRGRSPPARRTPPSAPRGPRATRRSRRPLSGATGPGASWRLRAAAVPLEAARRTPPAPERVWLETAVR